MRQTVRSMRRFPFRILFAAIFLPPVCYILSLNALEGYLQKREYNRVNEILVQNHEALYEGRYTVREEVNRNIRQYFLSHSMNYRLGIRVEILVKTADDRILYPIHLKDDFPSASMDSDFSSLPLESSNYVETAAENYRILGDGLSLSVKVRIKHNGWLSNGILVLYILIALGGINGFVRRALRESEREDAERSELIDNLTARLLKAESTLGEVGEKAEEYQNRIQELGKEKKDLSRDVDELLEEMEKQELGLKEQEGLKKEMETEVSQLRKEIDRLKEKSTRPKKKKKTNEMTARRFSLLYKNLVFTERSIEGFLDLTDEFQLKAEEIIHRLNEGDSRISIRRKVFGKGGKMNILETDFSYSGRIYFQRDSQGKTRIVTIGTKNSQEKDLAYIERTVG